jgi:cyclic dehypoxanthinyl futalosine synthase
MAITHKQALDFCGSDDLIGLGMEADAVRRRLHPEGVVTYLIDRTLRYTDFHSGDSGSGTPREDNLDFAAIYRKIAEAVEMGATAVLLQAAPGLQPSLKIESLEQLLKGIKRRYPQIWLHCFSAPEILAVAASGNLSVRDAIARLRDAGLDSIPGDGAQCGMEAWAEVHRTAHQLGIRTAAAMIFAADETFEDRVNHLEQVRRLQEETGGFMAFTPCSFQPQDRALAGPGWDEATAVEYLKLLAISRIYLDNIENIQSNLTTQGLKVLQMGLRFGGNDVGSVMPAAATGASRSTTEEDLRRVIRDAGFRPVQRDTLYRTLFLN